MKTFFQEAADASIKLYSDGIGSEDVRYTEGCSARVRRFNQLIKSTFQIQKSCSALKAAHLACFHLISPYEVRPALQGKSFRVGDRTYLDWKASDKSSLNRRALCPLTVLQLDQSASNPDIEWSAFCSWLVALEGYGNLNEEEALNQLRLDQIAWASRKLPMALFAHAIGLRPMRALSMITLARQQSGRAPAIDINEVKIERETQVAELVDLADEAKKETSNQHDLNLIEEAIEILTTTQNETTEEHIERWVRKLIALQNRASRASVFGLSVLAWVTDVCESGTVAKEDAAHTTRARYIRVSAIQILRMISKLGSDPAKWKREELEDGCLSLMGDKANRDKVGLGGGIASFLQFFHETWGAPLANMGFHKLIPPPRPRVQFVSEAEILRAVHWTTEQTGADEHLLKIVRVCLALGWAAPFRLQELLYLRVGNISPLKDGTGYEIEIVPRRGTTLKSPAATRRVTISPGWAADLLKEWLDLRGHQSATAQSYLFGTDTDPMLVYRKHAVRTTLLHLLKLTTGDAAMTFHALRHSWASIQVAQVLASSSIVNFDRLIHIAFAMGHVSPATTLFFYAHLAEDALGMHLNSLLREELEMNSSEAKRLLNRTPAMVRQHGCRKYRWDAEVSLWQLICESALDIDLPDCCEGLELVDPRCPRLGKAFVRTLTPVAGKRIAAAY